MKTRLLRISSLVVLVASCQAASSLPRAAPVDMPPTPEHVPLPLLVKGANLRPVGDRRRGYGTKTARQTIERLKQLGVNAITVLLEGRMASLQDHAVRPPSRAEIESIRDALKDANALGLATILIPHLYLDDGSWRGLIGTSEGRKTSDGRDISEAWWGSYSAFIELAAELGSSTGTTMLSIGVELKGLSDSEIMRERMVELAARVRGQFHGLLTYSANWDEAEGVRFWSVVDIAGVNGYYPLVPDPVRGAEAVARRLTRLSQIAGRDVLVLEVGYRASPLSHLRPWEWPEEVDPILDEASQTAAWAAVLTHWLEAEGVRGLLAWVIPTDPDDPASELPHGFNPLNKQAEHVLRRAFLE